MTEEVGSVDFVDWISVFTHLRGQQTKRSDRTGRTWDGGLIFVLKVRVLLTVATYFMTLL